MSKKQDDDAFFREIELELARIIDLVAQSRIAKKSSSRSPAKKKQPTRKKAVARKSPAKKQSKKRR
jgi:topoisomerase IA-like protein